MDNDPAHETVSSVADAPSSRRRRRKSGSKRAATWPEYWRSAQFGQHVFAAMCLIGAAYAGTILWETRFYSRHYPPVTMGVSESEVRYMLGEPDSVQDGGRLYRFSETGRELAARLSDDGRLTAISCAAGEKSPATCPRVRGIGIGTDEYDVLRTLGAPSRETYRGNDKTLHYDGMGLALQLQQFDVEQIQLHQGSSFSGYFPNALFAMIP